MPTSAIDWKPVKAPVATTMNGRYIRLEKLDPKRHGEDLWEALQGPQSDAQLGTTCPTARSTTWNCSTSGSMAMRSAMTRSASVWSTSTPARPRASSA